jgi:hypothetical protein
MPILEGFNPFNWDQRIAHILDKEPIPVYEIEPAQILMGRILLITDESGAVHIYKNGHKWNIGDGFHYYQIDRMREVIEMLDRGLRKKYKIVKIDAFLPFWFLKRLYLPDYWKPYKKSRKKRII